MRETLYSIQVNRMLYQFLQTFKILQSDIVIGQLKTSKLIDVSTFHGLLLDKNLGQYINHVNVFWSSLINFKFPL